MYRSRFLYQAIILWIFREIDGVPALKKSIRVKAKLNLRALPIKMNPKSIGMLTQGVP
ncbi:MAG: hypothetical protein ACJART_001084 [Maribacter sp.]|jgi:hypothetical protein